MRFGVCFSCVGYSNSKVPIENSISVCKILSNENNSAGDVIFHTRWLFHRTIPFHRDLVSSRVANDDDPLLYRRYSIRYGPGTSIIPPGYGVEPSVISDIRNGGRSADEVSQYDAAWYPR